MDRSLKSSAEIVFSTWQKITFTLLLLICCLLTNIWPYQALIIAQILNIFLLSFKLTLLLQAKSYKTTTLSEVQTFPIYTVLVPLYREHKIVKQLIAALQQLDYPKSKLDIKLIIESNDNEIKKTLAESDLDQCFEIIVVPNTLPKTKPKALNYGASFAKGEYLCVYDADDIPDPAQLKLALANFNTLPRDVMALQARLCFYNQDYNLLTKLQALEYYWWFTFQLIGLKQLKMPVILGGSSNHFKLEKLKELGLWDSYNVTEDADLGIRIAQSGYLVAILDSFTHEEATISIGAWLRQRSRWIKGHMQTYLVHMRNGDNKCFMGLQLLFLFPILTYLTMPFSWIGCSLLMASHPVISWLLMINTMLTLLLHAPLIVKFYLQHKWKIMLLYPVLCLFYWLLYTVAAYIALWQLISKPHFWDKTEHGVKF